MDGEASPRCPLVTAGDAMATHGARRKPRIELPAYVADEVEYDRLYRRVHWPRELTPYLDQVSLIGTCERCGQPLTERQYRSGARYCDDVCRDNRKDEEMRRLTAFRKALFRAHRPRFRSQWERQFAELLDLLDLEWKYEPETFALATGERYTPDFFVRTPLGPCFVEIHVMYSMHRVYGAKASKIRRLLPRFASLSEGVPLVLLNEHVLRECFSFWKRLRRRKLDALR